MATLAQFAEQLDLRPELTWPAPPEVHRTKSKPHLKPLPQVRAVTWNVYGTLLAISGGELLREHPQKFITDLALDKTIQEFKMWKAMSRKPGHPAEYMRVMIGNVLDAMLFLVEKGETHPETLHEKIWEGIIRKLMQNEYTVDTGKYGSLEEMSLKVAYFYNRCLQGVGAQADAADTVQWIKDSNLWQGLLADGQAYTGLHLQRSLQQQNPSVLAEFCIPSSHRVLSHALKSRKPSDKLYKEMIRRLKEFGISPQETLHVSNDLSNDLLPAKKHGFLTCLFTGDSQSLRAKPEEVADPNNRPTVMVTQLTQIVQMLAAE
ncbi:MAG TPA: HAD family hydrolase [Gemmatales bacterium]|nr:HAD family hydrolase [Gemmatales bacterium]